MVMSVERGPQRAPGYEGQGPFGSQLFHVDSSLFLAQAWASSSDLLGRVFQSQVPVYFFHKVR